MTSLATVFNGGLDPRTADTAQLMRVRTVSAACLIMLLIGGPYVYRYAHMGVPLMAWAVAATMVANAVNLWLLARTHSAELCGNIAGLALFVLLVTSNVVSGGFYDPNFAWLYVLPAGAALLLGTRSAVGWTLIVLATTFGFWLLPELGHPLPSLIPPEDHAVQSLFNRLSAITALALLVGAFVASSRRAERALHDANRALADEAANRARAEQEARTADRAKSAFLATVSHEIRTPLHASMGTASLLLETDMDEQQDRYVRTIRSSGNALLEIINEILDYTKIEAEGLELDAQDFDLRALVEGVRDLGEPLAHAKQLGLALSFSPELPTWVRGDAGRLRQILLNLLGNAVKFTDEGAVALICTPAPSGPGAVRVAVEVRDTGVGMTPDEVSRVFDPFSQADAAVASRRGGTGLGLTISRQLAQLMGGDITVQSSPGRGSCFRVELALHPAQGQPGAVVSSAPPPAFAFGHSLRPQVGLGRAGGPLRVLVADDNAMNRELMEQMLDKLDCAADFVSDGAAAVEVQRNGAYDAILMDCQMPGVDGFEATRMIRAAEPETERVPIVALTASAYASDRERALAAGMDDFLSKPFTFNALARVLARRLPRVEVAPEEEGTEAAPLEGSLRERALASIMGFLPSSRKTRQGALKLLGRFNSQAPERIAELRAAFESRDANRLEAAAHALKGGSGFLGLPELSEACARLLDAGRRGEVPEDESDIESIEAVASELAVAEEPVATTG